MMKNNVHGNAPEAAMELSLEQLERVAGGFGWEDFLELFAEGIPD